VSSSATVVVFCPQNPIPPRSGYHHRILSVVDAALGAGASVVVAGTDEARPAWTPEAERALLSRGVGRVVVRSPGLAGKLVRRASRAVLPRPDHQGLRAPEMAVVRWWLRWVSLRARASVVVGSYALWQRTLPTRCVHHVTVLDAIDVVSRNRAMWDRLEPLLPEPGAVIAADHPAIDPHLFDDVLADAAGHELAAFDRCDVTIAISPDEAAVIAAGTRRTRVTTLPMTLPAVEVENTWAGPALFTSGPNPFNVQGLLWFATCVLPDVLARAPDFRLLATGPAGAWVEGVPGIETVAFVDDLGACYATARMSLAPLLGCTGQQVKIVESLAHGVPVVATTVAARSSPLEHGVNGLVAADAVEFAQGVVALWDDPETRREMGVAARAGVAADHAGAAMRAELAALLARSSSRGSTGRTRRFVGRATDRSCQIGGARSA
jgi:hypothetical protein